MQTIQGRPKNLLVRETVIFMLHQSTQFKAVFGTEAETESIKLREKKNRVTDPYFSIIISVGATF